LRRIRKEFQAKDVLDSPHRFPNGCFGEPIGDGMDFFKWKVLIIGPEDSVYHGGYFNLLVTFRQNYPFYSLSVKFETKIYHMQVHPTRGGVNLQSGLLKDRWSPDLTLSYILSQIQEMMRNPDPMFSLDPEKEELFRTDRKSYDEMARKWVLEHAESPKEPKIENIKYRYSISEQQVLCTFNVSFSECDPQKLETFRFVAQWKDQRMDTELKRDDVEYTLTLPVILEYGGMITIESSLWSNDNDHKLPFSTRRHDIYLNALTENEYLLLIAGFWRKWCPQKTVLIDVVRLCLGFYDDPFELTMRWKLNRDSDCFIEQRTLRLHDAKYINLHRVHMKEATDLIIRKFVSIFGIETEKCWRIKLTSSSTNILRTNVFPKTIDIHII